MAVMGTLLYAVGEQGAKVEYIGGTLSGVKAGSDARIAVDDPSAMVVRCKQVSLRVPYPKINTIEYGQKVGRQVVAAIVLSPLFLLNKSRKHFLTLGYTDEQGAQQALVMRLDKNDIRAVLASLEARTGLKVVYLDEESRKM